MEIVYPLFRMGNQYYGVPAGYGLNNSLSEGSYTAEDETDEVFNLLNDTIFKALIFMYRRHTPLLKVIIGRFCYYIKSSIYLSTSITNEYRRVFGGQSRSGAAKRENMPAVFYKIEKDLTI
jgi:hypothetical protein